jgi:hypothetical protein
MKRKEKPLKPRNPYAYALALRGTGGPMEERRRQLLEEAAEEEARMEREQEEKEAEWCGTSNLPVITRPPAEEDKREMLRFSLSDALADLEDMGEMD